jgi:hypothetical protein
MIDIHWGPGIRTYGSTDTRTQKTKSKRTCFPFTMKNSTDIEAYKGSRYPYFLPVSYLILILDVQIPGLHCIRLISRLRNKVVAYISQIAISISLTMISVVMYVIESYAGRA